MRLIKNIYLLISVFTVSISYAVPGNYYNSLDTTKSCASFKTALYNLISSNTTVIPYALVDDYFDKTDLVPAKAPATGMIISDKYASDNPFGPDFCNYRFPTDFCGNRTGNQTECYCYDKEHVFPKSWFGGANIYPMYSDMHYIWPADNYVNFRKGNLAIGYVKSAFYTSKNGTKIGTSDPAKNYTFNSTNIFEPIDTFKGDFARAYLYVVTRYQDSIVNWINRSTASSVLDGNKYPGLKPWILQVCVKWSKMDPPSAAERKRNDSVFALQGNRNPYIDFPNWVEKVFGPNGISASCVSTGIIANRTVDFSIFPNPIKDAPLTIQTNTLITEDATVEIADILGRVLSTQKFNAGSNIIVDVNELDKGIYFLNLFYKNNNNVSTFIKQ